MPKRLSQDRVDLIVALQKEIQHVVEVARRTGHDRNTVSKVLREAGVSTENTFAHNHCGADSHLWKGGKETRPCCICGKPITRFPAAFVHNSNPCCSDECYRKFDAERSRGEKCHFWKGGVSEENNRERASADYRLWRQNVYRRDGFKCRVCGADDTIHAHHIGPWHKDKALRYDVGNGITLCAKHHEMIRRHEEEYAPFLQKIMDAGVEKYKPFVDMEYREPKEKECTLCHRLQPINNFHRSGKYRKSECKECRSAISRRRREAKAAEYVCGWCRKTFIGYRTEETVYCSRECAGMARRKPDSPYIARNEYMREWMKRRRSARREVEHCFLGFLQG